MKDNSEIGFEKELWASADKLRGSMDSSEYKHVILGLVFLKYISDKFEERYKELVENGDGYEEDKDAYTESNIFFVPEKSRFGYISENARLPEIGNIIDEAMQKIEKENSRLKNILPKNYSRPELDKRRLGEIIDLFSNIKIKNKNSKDILGGVYEYFLSQFASAKFIDAHSLNIDDVSIFGQENNPTTWKMCSMNLAIHGLEANLGIKNADSFHNDLHKTMKANYILANPPFNMSDWGADSLTEDARWKWGIPPNGNANYAWLSHIASKLTPNGKAGVVLANGSLSTQTGGEWEIRKNMIEDDIVECIISLPTQLFYSTQIPVSLWFLNRNKNIDNHILFIDARNFGKMYNKVQRILEDKDIKQIAETVHSWQKIKGYKDIEGYCKSVNIEAIRKENYILTPGRYVGLEQNKETEENFENKMKRLTEELNFCFKENRKLEKTIKEKLESIGYGI